MNKTIYLFEDKTLRMNDYHLSEEVMSFIKRPNLDGLKEQLEDYVDNELSNATLVLFHSSYRFVDQLFTVDKVKDVCLKKNIRFALFSGGLESNVVSENEVTLNSDDMYRNLPFFVDSLKEGHENLSMLVYGKDYILNPILRLLGKFNEEFWDIPGSDLLPIDRLEDFRDDIIKAILKGPLPEECNSLEKWVEEYKGRITKDAFRLALDRLLKSKMNYE